jgi:hypothetical protein
MVTLKISPCTNVNLTFNFDFGLDHPVHGGWVREPYTEKTKYLSNKKIRICLWAPLETRHQDKLPNRQSVAM